MEEESQQIWIDFKQIYRPYKATKVFPRPLNWTLLALLALASSTESQIIFLYYSLYLDRVNSVRNKKNFQTQN